MKFTRLFVICAAFGLSACSSSSTVTQRYAQPGDVIKNGDSFSTQAVKRLVVVNGTQSIKDQTIEFSVSEDGQTAHVTQNYKNYTLNWNDVTKRYEQGGASLIFENSISNVVQAAYFQDSVGSGYYNRGAFVFGYATNPTQVTNTTRGGSATYTGESNISVWVDGQAGYGDGTTNLNADFANQTIAGTINVSHQPSSGGSISFPDATIFINPSNGPNISGNQFNTDLDVTFVPVPGSTFNIAQTGLTGGFYGVNAAAIGATYWAQGDVNGDTLLIQGSLTAN